MDEGVSGWVANPGAMAGRSPYVVVLSDEQRCELERRAAAYCGSHRDVVRAKAILYAADGMSKRRDRAAA
jgi:hypothetical protein